MGLGSDFLNQTQFPNHFDPLIYALWYDTGRMLPEDIRPLKLQPGILSGDKISINTGFPLAQEKTPGADAESATIDELYTATWSLTTWALCFKITKELITAGNPGVVARAGARKLNELIPELREAVKHRRQLEAHRLVNGLRTALGPDGKATIASDHPRAGGGTASNTSGATGSITVDRLKTAWQNMAQRTNYNGREMNLATRPLKIVSVGSELLNMREIIHSVQGRPLSPDVAEAEGTTTTVAVPVNNVNVLTDLFQWEILRIKYGATLTTDAVFLLDEDHQLYFAEQWGNELEPEDVASRSLTKTYTASTRFGTLVGAWEHIQCVEHS